MNTLDLAEALESMAEEPTLCTALSAADVTELRAAAQRLRELEGVRHAALMLVQANNNDASMPLLMALHDTLDAALARVGGGM